MPPRACRLTGPLPRSARRPRTSIAIVCLLAPIVSGCPGGPGQGGAEADVPSESQAGSDTHPAWSPDGRTVAFISNRDGVPVGRAINFEVYRVAVGDTSETRLTTNEDFEADIAWSPDGARMLFQSFRDGNDEVYVMDADGGRQRNLTRSAASDGGPTWSPDGRTIAFHSDRGDGEETRLYLMDADGSNVRPLPNDPGPGHSPRWSPDGRRIAFVSGRDGNGEIYIMDADGSEVRRLTEDPRENGYPRWSPDGSAIAFTVGSFETDRWSVHLVGADGSNPRRVIEDTDSGNVAWSPDGRRLAFGRYLRHGDEGGEESRLYVFDLETGATTPLGRRSASE